MLRDETRVELDNLMKRFDDDLSGLQSQKEEEKKAQDLFDQQFEQLKHEVIWPVFVEFGNELSKHGHDFHVSEDKGYMDAIANYQPAKISFNIYPASLEKHFHKPESTPYIAFIANKYAKKIGIEVSTMMPGEGGVIGSHGEFLPQEVTKDLVETEVTNVLKNTLIFNHKSQ